MTLPTATPVVSDRLGREVPKGTKDVLVELSDGRFGVLTRVEVKSKRFVVRAEDGEVVARKAAFTKVLKAHGRFVKAAKLNDLVAQRDA